MDIWIFISRIIRHCSHSYNHTHSHQMCGIWVIWISQFFVFFQYSILIKMKYQFGFFFLSQIVVKLNSVVAQIIIWKSFWSCMFFLAFRDNPLPYALFFFRSIVLSCLVFVYFLTFASHLKCALALARVCVAILFSDFHLITKYMLYLTTNPIYLHFVPFFWLYIFSAWLRMRWSLCLADKHTINSWDCSFSISILKLCMRVSKVYRPLFVRKVFGMWCEEQSEWPITTLKIRKKKSLKEIRSEQIRG